MAKKTQTGVAPPVAPVAPPTGKTPVAPPVAPVAPTDYSAWLTKKQAAETIGVSTKAIERYVHGKKLEQRFRRQAGRSDVAVFHPDDVARLARQRRPAPVPFLMPHTEATGQALARVPVATGEELLRALVAAVPTKTQTAALFLTLAEASEVSGLPQADLRRAIEAGELKPRKTGRGGWRIRRRDLEAL